MTHLPSPNIARILPNQNKAYPTSDREHILLCKSRGPAGINGVKHNSKWARTRNRKYNAKKQSKSSTTFATHSEATVQFHTSDMVLNIHSDASFLSEANAYSRACRHFFMGWKADPTKPIKLNGAYFTLCAILRFVVASTAEAKLGALYLNCKQATIFRLTLEEMGHPQPPTPIHSDNSTAVGIANNTVKRRWSRSMEMRFFGLRMQLNKENLTSSTT